MIAQVTAAALVSENKTLAHPASVDSIATSADKEDHVSMGMWAALKLQHAGLITYARGHITVLDREAMEGRCCECYRVVKDEYARLLPHRIAT